MKKLTVDKEIFLKPLELESSDIIYNKIADSKDFLQEWLPWVEKLNSADDLRKRINSLMERCSFRENVFFEIWYNDDFAGIVSLRDHDMLNKKADIGYWLTKDYVGKGIIIRSLKTLITYAFKELEMHKLQIRCSVDNPRSCNVPKQLEFYYEGIEREGEYRNNKFIDLKVYSLLKKEWMKFYAAK